jgi:sulfoxide reductase heme-binding subunit YedZ
VAALATVWLAAWLGRAPDGLAWTFLRLSGVVGYAALAASVVLGALTSSRYVPAWLAKPLQFGWHGVLSGFGLASIAVHVAFSLVDAQYPQTLAGVLVPGSASYAPFALALGTVASYATLVVYVSIAQQRRLARVWVKRLHLLAYPAFALATVHGVLAGSDRLGWLYLSALALVVLATTVRVLERRSAPRPAGARLDA